jgi:hypothetical protein
MPLPPLCAAPADTAAMGHLPVILSFLDRIGIPHRFDTIASDSFVPGMLVHNGALVIDLDKMRYPGDALHEAGHIAVTSSAQRPTLCDISGDGEEIAAVLWSFAAARACGVPLAAVFHPDGYKGDASWIMEMFEAENYIGLPLLEWMNLTADKQRAATLGVPPFPHMLRWLRE